MKPNIASPRIPMMVSALFWLFGASLVAAQSQIFVDPLDPDVTSQVSVTVSQVFPTPGWVFPAGPVGVTIGNHEIDISLNAEALPGIWIEIPTEMQASMAVGQLQEGRWHVSSVIDAGMLGLLTGSADFQVVPEPSLFALIAAGWMALKRANRR